jgi:diaminopimelate decarboxylase
MEVPTNVQIGDFAILKGTGAYCSAMSLKNYNSFPEIAEVLLLKDSQEVRVIRKR